MRFIVWNILQAFEWLVRFFFLTSLCFLFIYRSLGARALSESELDNTLPPNEEEKDSQVESLLVDRVARFLQSHTLQLKVPEQSISDMKRSLDEGKTLKNLFPTKARSDHKNLATLKKKKKKKTSFPREMYNNEIKNCLRAKWEND